MQADRSETSRKTSLSAIAVMICTLISRILGFIRIAVIGAFFGASGEADVLNSVFSIPNNLRKLMAEGALSTSFIPVLSESIVKEKNSDSTLRLVRNILTFQAVVLIPLCLLSVIFSDFLISNILLDFDDPYLNELSVSLFRWFINYILLISISAALMAVLNSRGYFFIPAITPLLFSVSVISSIVLLYKTLGIFSMAAGVISGGLLQVFFQLPLFYKLGYDLKPDFNFKSSYFKKIMKNWGPVAVTASVFTINQQIAIRFASGLDTGSTSALSYALVFWQLPFGIFSASITTVLFPKMSRFRAEGDNERLLSTVSSGMRNLMCLLLPSGVFLFFLGPELISIAMQRGFFSAENTNLTSHVLKGYAPGLFTIGMFNFSQRFYYSAGNFKKPFYFAAAVSIIDISFSLWLKETFLRVTGLAVANSVSFTLIVLFIVYDIRKSYPDFRLFSLIKDFIKIIISLLPATVLIIIAGKYYGFLWQQGLSSSLLLYFFIITAVFSIIVLTGYKLLKIDFIFFRRRS